MKPKRYLIRIALGLILLASIAPVFFPGALGLSESMSLVRANLESAGFVYRFTPNANSDYALYAFSADGGEIDVKAQLLEDDRIIATGEGRGALFSCWLVAGVQYTVHVQGSGSAILEFAREALSRSFGNPFELKDGTGHSKMIARSGDAHWYRFKALQTAPIMLTCLPEDPGLQLGGALFSSDGTLIQEFESLSGGGSMLTTDTEVGKNYYIRIYSPKEQEGFYSLTLKRGATDSLSFKESQYSLTVGGEFNLWDELNGEAAVWVSDTPGIINVTQDGTLRAQRAGMVTITAYGLNASASCRVNAEYVPLEGISILGSGIQLSVGDDTEIIVDFMPENASDQRLRYSIDNPEIASITQDGVLTAKQTGKATLRVISSVGGFTDSIQISVDPAVPKYRALLIGEQNYPSSVNSVRNGSENSINALSALLSTAEFESASYVTNEREDSSRAEIIAQIRQSFQGATEQDVSLFYITSHGYYSGGMSFLELTDGSVLSARDLERELRRVPGTVIVMIDCCGSGGAIGAQSDLADFADGITGAFAGASFSLNKYKVLVSAGLDQDSYRIAFNENADSGVMATVFSRALCDGAGWNIDLKRRGTMSADENYDAQISLNELYQYMYKRVNWYLEIASKLTGSDYRQSVQVYPEGDPFVLFKRK